MTSNVPSNSSHRWSSSLTRLFRPHRNPVHVNNFGNPKLARHPPGAMWKQALCGSIFEDLTATVMSDDHAMEVAMKRFVRLECLGLSGVIVYDLPSRRNPQSCEHNQRDTRKGVYLEQDLSAVHEDGVKEQDEQELTLSSVFGNPEDPEDQGMEIDYLLDRVGAQLIYVPLYACTSFATGQVMAALMYALPIHPLPAPRGFGFSIDAHFFHLSDIGLFGESDCLASYKPKPVIDVSVYLKPTVNAAERVIRDRLLCASVPDSGSSRGTLVVQQGNELSLDGLETLDRTLVNEELYLGPVTTEVEVAETTGAEAKDERTEGDFVDESVFDIGPDAFDSLLNALLSSFDVLDAGANEHSYTSISEQITVDHRTDPASVSSSVLLESTDDSDSDSLDTSISTTNSSSLDLLDSLLATVNFDLGCTSTPPRGYRDAIAANLLDSEYEIKRKSEPRHGFERGRSFLSMEVDDEELELTFGDGIVLFDRNAEGGKVGVPQRGSGFFAGDGDVESLQDKENRVHVLRRHGPGVRWSL